MMESRLQKKNFIKCIKDRIWTFKVFKGEAEGEIFINYDVSHLQLEQGEQSSLTEDENMKTLSIMYNTQQKRDCFFFSPVGCDQYDTLYQHYLYGQTIKIPNLHRDPPNLEKLIERGSLNSNSEELVLSNNDKLQFLDLLEISLIQEVELMGNRQFKNAIIYISRQKFKETIKNNTVLDQKLQKVVQKVQGIWKDYSTSDLQSILTQYFKNTTFKQINCVSQISISSLKKYSERNIIEIQKEHSNDIITMNILIVISKEYKIANHNTAIESKFRKDQLCLFWPLLDETDFSNPYIDVDQLKSRNKVVDLKPGHHIFVWPGTLSLFCNSQKHAIYDGNNKVVTFSLNKEDCYAVETMTLQKFKQDQPFISLCEYGIKEEDAFFRRSYTYSNRQSDHPFKVLLKSNLLQTLRDPIKIPKNKHEVDYFSQFCKTSFFFDAKTRKLHGFIDKIVAAFNDTFFVSLGQ